MPGKQNTIFLYLLAACLFCACSVPTQNTATPPASTKTQHTSELTPFIRISSTPTLPAISLPTITAIPSPTPTPRTHIVKKGEDMLGIAFIYKITLEELMAANPDVKPNLMSVGAVLIIPGSGKAEEEGAVTETANIQPTAIPVDIGPVFCTATQEGGAWCSLPVRNTQEFALEGLSAVIHLVDTKNQATLSQTAFLPLDLLQPGQSLPFSTYFPAPVPTTFQASAEILSALPNPDDGRYLPTRIDHQQVFLASDGLSAEIQLDVFLGQTEIAARRVWVAAIAYDKQGNVIGLRRWENPNKSLLTPGKALPVSLMIYSSSGQIHQVELAAEARP